MLFADDYDTGKNKHVDEIIEHFNKAKNEKLLCDVILRSGSLEVYAHRVVLSRLSVYFSRLMEYEGGFGKSPIRFEENIITEECLENIVRFAYTGEIIISNDNVVDLILAADYFDLEVIGKPCVSYMVNLSDDIFLTNENLINFVCFACSLPYSFLHSFVSNLISKHFIELKNILTSLPPNSLLTIISAKDFTVCDHRIHVFDADLELFMFIVDYIGLKELSQKQITELLETINFSEIQLETLSSIFKSHSNLKTNYLCSRLLLLREMPFYGEQVDINRFRSRKKRHLTADNSHIDIDDRICSIKVHKCKGINALRETYNLGFELLDEERPLIVGFEITYKSGKIIEIGDTSAKLDQPSYKTTYEEIILSKNEVIVKISTNFGMLSSIKFVTNFKKEFHLSSSTSLDDIFFDHQSRSEDGYFHSFHPSSTMQKLHYVWVESSYI